MYRYLCENCGKYFSRISHLKYHINIKHKCIKQLYDKKTFNKSPLRPLYKTCRIGNYNTVRLINTCLDISKYKKMISPFFTNGNFEFYIQSEYKLELLCNVNCNKLYNFWKVCKYEKNTLYKNLIKINKYINKYNISTIKKNINNITNSLLSAIYFYIINLYSGYDSFKYKKKQIKLLLNLFNLELNDINLLFGDYTKIICDNINNTENLLFLKIPYFIENIIFDHISLYNIIKNNNNWIILCNDTNYIRKIYNNFKIFKCKRNTILVLPIKNS